MGDIYRLLGTGVRRIVIIDGRFHGPAAIWPREIVEALDNGIEVIGAASMGALRAAELYPLGMKGHGTVFAWYRDGVIDGDDEVALLHGDETVDFQPLSEPLVNLRYNLQQAARCGIITLSQAEEVIEEQKAIYYAERSYQGLLAGQIVTGWRPETQALLRQFIQQAAINLKQQDAISTLRYCTAPPPAQRRPAPALWARPSPNPYYQFASYQQRGFLHSTGTLVSGKTLLDNIVKKTTLVKAYRPILSKNFFLLQWAQQKALQCPTAFYEAYWQRWRQAQNNVPYDQWLRMNGLTEGECQTELRQRALLQWLIQQEPASFGLEANSYTQIIQKLPPMLRQEKDNLQETERALWIEAMESAYLADWAREKGITCPTATVEAFIATWEANLGISERESWLRTLGLHEECYWAGLAACALSNWLSAKGPHYFGYTTWSFEVALMKELQITGRAAQLLANLE